MSSAKTPVPNSPGLRIGVWQELASPAVSRYLSAMKWDFVVLDMQHGCMSFETAYECIQILRAAGIQPWVRVAIAAGSDIQRALDIGAQTVVVPMVNSAADAVQAANAAKYPPLGQRSVGGDFAVWAGRDYPESANQSTSLLIQIEHIDGVQEIDEILSISGVDGCFVGPTDLALSMSLPLADFAESQQHREAIQLTLDSSRAHAKLAGCNCYSLLDAQQRMAQGWNLITYRSDVDLFMQAGVDLISQLREAALGAAPIKVETKVV